MSGVKLKAVKASNGLLTQLKCSDDGELNVNVSTSTLSVNVDGLEGLVGTTNGKLDTINTTLTAGGVVDISTLSTHAKQDTINNSVNSLGLPITALFGEQQTSNGHLTNIYSRQDDILTSNNASKLSNATTASKITSLESTNHTDLTNIYSRQDDILTASNASKLSVASLDTNFSSHQTTNNNHLTNIYSRQDDILTSTNAVKTNTQSLEDCVASNKVNVNISSGIGDLATESTLQTIAEFNCDTTDVTISSSALPSGASTSAKQGAGLPSALSSNNLRVSLKETIDVPITNGALTELASALNSDKLDVNISSGNISGFSTSALQGTANGHLLALANIVNPAIATATATTIPNKLDIIETTANAIETKTTLHTTSELKELLSGITINSNNLSTEFDFENYRHARFFGETTASVGTDFIVMGSNTSGGSATFYVMGENLRSETIGSTHYIYSPHIENLPRYIKILNKSGSTNYIFTKLYVQLSEGRVAV